MRCVVVSPTLASQIYTKLRTTAIHDKPSD